jgi:hypothetical protein
MENIDSPPLLSLCNSSFHWKFTGIPTLEATMNKPQNSYSAWTLCFGWDTVIHVSISCVVLG